MCLWPPYLLQCTQIKAAQEPSPFSLVVVAFFFLFSQKSCFVTAEVVVVVVAVGTTTVAVACVSVCLCEEKKNIA